MKSYIIWVDNAKGMGFIMNFVDVEGYMLVLHSPWSKKDLSNSEIY